MIMIIMHGKALVCEIRTMDSDISLYICFTECPSLFRNLGQLVKSNMFPAT